MAKRSDELQAAIEIRNLLAKLIRQGAIERSAEYDALDNAINAELAPPTSVHTAWYQLPVAKRMWEGDNR